MIKQLDYLDKTKCAICSEDLDTVPKDEQTGSIHGDVYHQHCDEAIYQAAVDKSVEQDDDFEMIVKSLEEENGKFDIMDAFLDVHWTVLKSYLKNERTLDATLDNFGVDNSQL